MRAGASTLDRGGMTRPLLCRLGMHKWRKMYNEQGQMYRNCERCDRDDDPGARPSVAPGG